MERKGKIPKNSLLPRVAVVALHESTYLAAPNSHERSAVALGTTPRQDISIGSLDNTPLMRTASGDSHA